MCVIWNLNQVSSCFNRMKNLVYINLVFRLDFWSQVAVVVLMLSNVSRFRFLAFWWVIFLYFCSRKSCREISSFIFVVLDHGAMSLRFCSTKIWKDVAQSLKGFDFELLFFNFWFFICFSKLQKNEFHDSTWEKNL